MRALVVDDSRAMRTVLRRMLQELGFDVLEAGDGAQALDVLASASQAVDVALIDWHMPEMDGLELVSRLQDDPALFRMRKMMVTAETDMRRVMDALRAGADEYLMKPVTKEALVDKLHLLGFEPTGQLS